MILNFTKVGPSEWIASYRGKSYVVTERPGEWLLAINGKVEARTATRGNAIALAHSIASMPAATTRKAANKWQHDGIDRHESWWYGPPDCDLEDAIGTVHPDWGEGRGAGIGKPAHWIARNAKGEQLGSAPTRREATALVERHAR